MDDEDALLYGDGPTEDTDRPAKIDEKSPEENEPSNIDEQIQNPDAEVSHQSQEYEVIDEEGGDDEDDSDDEDNVQVIINQDKIEEAKTTFQNLGIAKTDRQIPIVKKGKFTVEEFDKVGTIDGQPAQEIDLEAIDDKPWKKPGADITDYFNYGFTEETWAAYCARQKRIRLQESGVGLPNNPGSNVSSSTTGQFSSRSHNGGTIPTLGQGIKRLGPSSSDRHRDRDHNLPGSSDKPSSGIAVLTADKRDYSKKIIQNMDFSVPPPGMNVPPPSVPPPNFSAPPPASDDFDPFAEDQYDNYAGGYEPTQESQWVAPPSTYLGGGDNPDAPPGDAAYEDKRDPWQRNGRRGSREDPERDRRRRRSRSRSRDRYRERDRRDRDRGIDKDRERGIDKERSIDKDRGTDKDRERGIEKDRERGVDKDRERDRRRDRDRDRDRERDRKRERSKSRSPRRDSKSPSSSDRHKHKKSKREKRERSEKSDRDIKKEVKDEPEDYVE